MEYIYIVWSKGEKTEKSCKNQNQNQNPTQEENNENNENNKDIKVEVEDTIKNKRELANTKLKDRNMISQIGQNPFMINNNYLEDLEIQQNFLIPQNSNIKEKIIT